MGVLIQNGMGVWDFTKIPNGGPGIDLRQMAHGGAWA
jgi:hypothetical protein